MQSLITAVVKPHVVEAVRDAVQLVGASGMTVTPVSGYGRQKGHTETYRGAEYEVSFVPKVRLDLVVPTELADAIVGAIADVARTGQIGDGKVWVTDVRRVVRIRTGDVGDDAI